MSVLENQLSEVQDSSSICKDVNWVPMSRGARLLLQLHLGGVEVSLKGQFGMSSKNVYCFQVPVRISTLVKSPMEYSKLIPLPELHEIPHDRFVRGFSLKWDREASTKQLIFPVGFLKEYIIDKTLSVPNVTVYVYKDTKSVAFFGEGVFDLCGTKFQVKIEQTKPDETVLTGRSPYPIDLSTVELAFGFRQPTEDLIRVMENFKILKLRLINPKLHIHWKDKEKRTMRLSGHAFNSAWGNNKEVNVELLLGRGQSFWATAVTTSKRSFKEIFSLFTDLKHVRLAKILDTALDIDQVCLMIFFILSY